MSEEPSLFLSSSAPAHKNDKVTPEIIVKDDYYNSWIPPRWLLSIFAVVLGFKFLQSLQEIATFLTIAYFLGYLVQPPLLWLERRKISRPVGCIFVSLGLGIMTFLVFFTVIPHLIEQTIRLTEHLPSSLAQAEITLKEWASKIPYLKTLPLEKMFERARITRFMQVTIANPDFLKGLQGGVTQALLQGYSLTLTLLNLVLLPLFVVLIAIEFPNFHRSFLLLLPRGKQEEIVHLARSVDGTIMSFLRGQLLVGLILTILYSIGLAVIGLDLALPVGIIAGFGNLIPYLGTTIGVLLALLFSLTGVGTFWHITLVVIVFSTVQFLEGFVITPRIVGQSVGLSPLMVIVSLMIAGKLFGLLGICLAVPCTAAVKTLLREILNRRSNLIIPQ
jgi:predicted PurR-regulated permease PerM